MLTETECQELDQERHIDELVEAQSKRERISKLRQEFTFVICMLEAQESAAVLLDKRRQLLKPSKRNPYPIETPLIQAMWDGYWALTQEAVRAAQNALQCGQLLFAWHGSPLLKAVKL